MDVTVYDKVWAEIHLGIIDKHWDILLVEVCYKGRLSYNMNIVKVTVVRNIIEMKPVRSVAKIKVASPTA